MSESNLRLQLLGSITLWRDGQRVVLPSSRKLRALLALLAVTRGPTLRTQLCEMLWDTPDDPRRELRWCLSKIRGALGDADGARIASDGDAIALHLSDIRVDVAEVVDAGVTGIENCDVEALRRLEALFVGEFADGLEIERSPSFSTWLSAQRRRFRVLHVALLEQLAKRLPAGSQDALEVHEKWLRVAPFDRRAHEHLLAALTEAGRMREAEEHIARAIQLFEAEGLNWMPLREAWLALKGRAATPQVSIETPASVPNAGRATEETMASAARASICVMPFTDLTSAAPVQGGLADGLTDDIITRLARLRVLFVIARGSVYALRERKLAPDEAARVLNVNYVVSGVLRTRGDQLSVAVELTEARSSRIVWADELQCRSKDVLQMLQETGDRIVACVAEEIELAERNRAMLKAPESLNAWEAYHRGLWYMYRFTVEDNDRAAHFFAMAARQDPTFARAHSGLSFTHFQNAFLLRTADRSTQTDLAYETAQRSLIADDRDPAAHWAMGRALWLRGRQDESLRELEQCVSLSPNFALGHYTAGFVHSQSGDARLAIKSSDYSRSLSPFDPLQFAMLASRALAHLRLGQYEEAADWAFKGAMRPNAHVHIQTIAAHCLAAAGRVEEGRSLIHAIHKTAPAYTLADFLAAFRFDETGLAAFHRCAAILGSSQND
jgi:DNA-binding SARP family transcriptional activator